MRKFLALLILFISIETLAQEKNFFTGSLGLDVMKISDVKVKTEKISPYTAGILSAVIPGSGQVYTKSYLRAVIYLAVEIASWGIYINYTKKGNRQTEFFKRYADENWSVVDYASWINEWISRYGTPDAPKISINPDQNLKPWQRVNWRELNDAERYISSKASGFSHTLPNYGEQQYYELIGKYHQYAPGWNDFDRNFIPEDVRRLAPTQKFLYYSRERGKANDFYTIATTFSFVIVANHVLSAFDATLTAILHNKRIQTKSELNYNPLYGMNLKFSLSF